MRSLMYIAVLTMGLVGTAIAEPIDFDAAFMQFDGKPFIDKDGKPEILTLGRMCETALLAVYPDEEQANVRLDAIEVGKEKYRRYRIANKIHNAAGKPIELAAEDILVLKKLIAKGYQPYLVGRAWDLLDPVSTK